MTPLLEDRRWRIISPELIGHWAIRETNKQINLIGNSKEDPADPRPIESLQEIIKPETIFNEQGAIGPRKTQFEDLPLKKWQDQGRLKEYGGREGILGFILCNPSNHYSRADSSPFPPHYPKLSGLDRQEFESGYIKGGKIMMPHLDNGNIPDYLRIKNIMYKAGCSADEARAIGDLASILDSTPKMVDEFCSWAKIRSADKLLDYLYPLSLGAVEAETLPKFKPNTNEWGEPARLKADKDLFNPVVADDLFISLEDVEEIQEISNNSDEPTVKVVGSQTLWPHQIEDEEVWEAQAYDWEPEEIEPKGNGSYVSYHVLEDFGLMQSKKAEIIESIRLKNGKLPEGAYEWLESLDKLEKVEDVWNKKFGWEARQPGWYKGLLTQVRNIGNLDILSELGKEVHARKPPLTRDQAGAFWTQYNRAKLSLENKINLGPTARGFIQRIIKANGNLGSLGAWLYKAQQGTVRVSKPPQDREWTLIWKAYHDMKEVHATDQRSTQLKAPPISESPGTQTI